MPKSIEEKIADFETKASQAAERKERTEALKKYRNGRTHRLCTIGGLVESVFGKDITEDQIPNLKSFLIEAKKILGDFRSFTNGDC